METALIFALLIGLAASRGLQGGGGEERIVDGVIAQQGQFPYMVSVQHVGLLSKRHICSGIIINDNHVLTAASCVSRHLTLTLQVVAGEQTLHQNSHLEEEKHVQSIFLHEDFDAHTLSNDIAILRTSHNFVFVHDLVQKAPLPEEVTAVAPTEGDLATIAGWGLTTESGDQNNDLRYGNATYLSRDACVRFYGSNLGETSSCLEPSPSGTCDGDDGGPVIVGGQVMGLVSHRRDCSLYPTVATSVVPFLSWINNHLEA